MTSDRNRRQTPLTALGPVRGWGIVAQLIALLLLSPLAIAQEGKKVLRCGWYLWDPYQYIAVKQNIRQLTGLDVQLVRTVFSRIGHEVSYEEIGWKQHQLDIKNGVRDIAAGAFKNPERAEYAYYSAPYRKETDVVYVRKGESSRYRYGSVSELIARFRDQNIRLGVISGFYYGPELATYISDPANASRIVRVANDVANFQHLLDRRIDAFVADRLVGETLAWKHGWQLAVEELSPPVYSADIHVIFSKKTTTPQLVEAFNRSLHELRQSGQYSRIVREYLFPSLLGATVAQWWFLTIDILGTIAFAISGILLAHQGRYSLFGALVLASLPALAGGIMRDLVVNREKLAVLSNPVYLSAVVLTVLAGYVAFKLAARLRPASGSGGDAADGADWFLKKITVTRAVAFFDALGLAAFTVIGVVVAVESRSEPLWLWGPLLGALTGAGGGIIRDVFRADANNPFLKGTFYAEVALIWGLALSLFLTWYANRLDYEPGEISLAVITTLIGALLTRMAVFHYRVRSPMY
ncbi:MAG TPA: transporter substrate-binding domain-containing protein [Burkholderiales bacterium]|nr:transporter substrate-binding domain-containing protein [Burkholderiales bacterium]